ncbi:la-related protein 7-like isoform X5 [Quercus lobata]|uniref:la-related protein 7-like isoform X5 n=1 Tax=Quercus lobata TaxID=97700 RepID=UPI0012484E00|nr:la-related protein 7-like isoform X5 [Quercus lobata]
MGFVGYLFFALKCFDLFACPLFSLGYPLCASICAIESNSNSDTRKLIAYWVFYSLISLFEHAFMKLLEWLPFWPHMKLIIMYWLMIPHFGNALYFYELLVQPCLSLVPQIVINLFNEWKEHCLKRDGFPTEAAERYQKQNESEASEELISSDESKSIENNVGQKEDKDVEVTEENEDVEVTEKNEVAAIERSKSIENNVGQKEDKDVEVTEENEDVEVTEENEDVEVTEKNEVAAIERSKSIEDNVEQKEDKDVEVTKENEDVEVTEENEDVGVTEKNEVVAIERVTPIESTLVQTGKSIETLTDMNVTSKSTPDFTKVQKEWACAICKVTIQSETTLNSHLQGKRHKANCEVLKAITRAKKKNFPTSTTKKHEQTQTQKKCASSNGLKEEVNIKQWDVHGLQINSKKIVQDTRSPLSCYICNLRCPNKDNLDGHLKGKKHLARIRELADFVEGLSCLWVILYALQFVLLRVIRVRTLGSWSLIGFSIR